ncbi:MAG: DNA polymerase III subunit beta [Patescibacteria group bacterium]
MKFTCTQENLILGLTMVSHVTGKNVNLPILGNALLKTENGNLKLSSTNLEIAVSCLVRGKVDQEGEYSVPAKLLLDYISLLPSGKVEMTLTDDGLDIGSNGQETTIKGMAASEFPLLPKLAKGEGYHLSTTELKRALGQVTFAASTSESRPELMGVACFFGIGDGSKDAVIAATDSYRLAERKMTLTGGPKHEVRTIVPARSMIEIGRIVSSYKDDVTENADVTWTFTENQLVVTFGNVELVTRLIEGTFPPYQDIIPKEFKTEAVVARSELQKAVRAASLFSRQGLFDVHLTFDPDAGTCTVASADQGTGKTKTDVKGSVTGTANKATLNYRYVMDGLSAMQTETVRIVLIDDNNPILLLPEPMSEAYRYLVMPIRQ